MEETYDAHGVRFQFPADWEVTEQAGDAEIMITVSSPQTSFWTVGLFYNQPSPEQVVETVVGALREEYENLDDYEVVDHIGDRPTVARDVEFFCLELVNSAWVRAFAIAGCTVLVFYQANDQELEATAPVFELLCGSLVFDENSLVPEEEEGRPDEWA